MGTRCRWKGWRGMPRLRDWLGMGELFLGKAMGREKAGGGKRVAWRKGRESSVK